MGALALYIVQRYVVAQERDSLQRNAEQVAARAEAFLDPQQRRVALEQLAFASAFLGDARVRIMDAGGVVLADSGDPGLPDEFLWLVPSPLEERREEIGPRGGSDAPVIIPLPSFARNGRDVSPREIMPLLRDLPFGSSLVFARRVLTPWGRRFVFEEGPSPDLSGSGSPSLPRTYVTTSVAVGAPGSPLGTVELSGPLSLSGETLRPLRNAVLLSGLGSLVIALAVGFLFGRTISDPLHSLARTARRMGEGDLGARAAVGRRDEIGELGRQINGMAESLEKSFRELRSERDSLKRFVADASHELRTPITALATFNELLQGSASGDEAARGEFLRESQAQLGKLQWITTNLLDLSRLDAGIAALSVAGHPAGDLLERAAAAARPRAKEKGVTLRVERPEPEFTATCDANWMEIALSNLLTNGVKFLPPGGTVTIGAAAADGMARFVVRDDGPGIPADELPRIFERFYRGRNAGSDGAGLGLAIVQSVANAHAGRIDVQSAPGAGSTFTLEIPLGSP
jgi:signal transduction histidine kinase